MKPLRIFISSEGHSQSRSQSHSHSRLNGVCWTCCPTGRLSKAELPSRLQKYRLTAKGAALLAAVCRKDEQA